MRYKLYTLKFSTPVHFADADFGGDLDKSSITCSADTYFNALCFEASQRSVDLFKILIDKFTQNRLKISSLFPYYKNDTVDDVQFYLPKPCNIIDKMDELSSYSEQKQYHNQLKKADKEKFIRVSKLKSWLKSTTTTNILDIVNPIFAIKTTSNKVSCRQEESLPYFVSSYQFSKNAGLYFIVGFEDDSDIDFIEPIIESLGYSGIGGKKSSGYGKYSFGEDPWELDEKFAFYQDDLILYKMLNTKNARFMAITPIIPELSDIRFMALTGTYNLFKRSGYIYDKNTHIKLRKNDVYMIAEGSLLLEKIQGILLKEEYDKISYPIYRYGMGMFVGIDYE